MVYPGGCNQLYVTDLDGTLLRSSGQLSLYAARLLTRLIRRHRVSITYATSRSRDKARAILKDVPFDLPAIVLNGAMVADGKTGAVMHSVPLAPDVVMRVLAVCEGMATLPFVLGQEAAADVLLWSAARNEGQANFLVQRRGDPRLRRCDPLRPASLTLGITIVDREEILRDIMRTVERGAAGCCEFKLTPELYCPGWHVLEIFDKGVDKAEMLRRVCGDLGIPLAHVTVFGDQLSDLAMMRAAGTAVAVGSAHAEVRARAHAVIGSNDEDAVPRYIRAQCRVGATRATQS